MRYAEGVNSLELSEPLVRTLKMAEIFSRREIVITSAFRDGDVRCHGKGLAVDLACTDSNDRYRLVTALTRAGIDRIGLYSAHIHADLCVEPFPQEVLWLGGPSK